MTIYLQKFFTPYGNRLKIIINFMVYLVLHQKINLSIFLQLSLYLVNFFVNVIFPKLLSSDARLKIIFLNIARLFIEFPSRFLE